MSRVIFQATLACLLLVYAFIQMQGHPTGRGGKAQENSDSSLFVPGTKPAWNSLVIHEADRPTDLYTQAILFSKLFNIL